MTDGDPLSHDDGFRHPVRASDEHSLTIALTPDPAARSLT